MYICTFFHSANYVDRNLIFQRMSDLLVIGAGVLGMEVARRWKTRHSGANVTLKFRSVNTERSAQMEREGFRIITKEAGEKLVSPSIVFCAPPTGNNDYAEVFNNPSME